MKKLVLVIVALGLMLSPMNAHAGFEASSWTENESYLGKTGGKLVFGLKNLLFGIGDIFYEPHRFKNEGGSAWLGLGKGIIDVPFNIIEGALHVVTFPIPVDVPLPDGGVNFDVIETEHDASSYKVNQYARANPS